MPIRHIEMPWRDSLPLKMAWLLARVCRHKKAIISLTCVRPVADGARTYRQSCQAKRVPAGFTNGLQLAQISNTCAVCDSGNTKNISSIIVLSGAVCYCLLSEGDRWGATLEDFFSGAELNPEISNAKNQSTGEPIDELSRSLLARITRTVVKHETDDWPGDYDRLYALICKVVAQSNLRAETKPLLTRHLIERVANLEKKWPKRRHMKSRSFVR
jgi:hypothetical protein